MDLADRGNAILEPLGTITMYFGFLDDDTRNVLKSIMKEAYSYYDFVKTLIQRVLDADCTDLVVYFAIHHAGQILDLKSINEIGRKYSDRLILMPNLFFASAFQGHSEDFDNARKAADAVLATNPDTWLALEMRFMKFESESWKYPKTVHDTSNLNAILDMIHKEKTFGFYETIYYSHMASHAHIDGDSEERKRCNEKAIEFAKVFDDKIRLAYCLLDKANIVESDDRKHSRELLNKAGNLMKILGSEEGYSHVLESISKLEAIRGEFNIAIDHYLEVISIRELLGLDNGNISLVLSTLYNAIGEFESGLDWGRMAEDQFKIRPNLIPRAVLNQAWSLTALKKKTESKVLTDSVRKSITKSGHEALLAWLHFVDGLMDFEDGNFISAVSSIEEALKIYETREGTMMIQFLFLRHLAMIEVFHSQPSTEVFPYLTLLEERASSEDLPGVMGQTLLLKSEVALLQNDDSRLREALQQLRPLSQEPSLAFIVPYYDRLLSRI